MLQADQGQVPLHFPLFMALQSPQPPSLPSGGPITAPLCGLPPTGFLTDRFQTQPHGEFSTAPCILRSPPSLQLAISTQHEATPSGPGNTTLESSAEGWLRSLAESLHSSKVGTPGVKLLSRHSRCCRQGDVHLPEASVSSCFLVCCT